MTRTLAAACGIAALFAVAGCGSTDTTQTVVPATTAATVAPTPTPTPAARVVTQGRGDTTTNPDSAFDCAASATLGGTVIAYVTATGTNPAVSQAGCDALTAGGAWVAVQTLPAQGYYAAPQGWVTIAQGPVSDTVRVYTAAGGDPAMTEQLYQALVGGFAALPVAS